MPTRKAQAEWSGDLMKGRGWMTVESGLFTGDYSFTSRFEQGPGTNPEELLGAAHAGCYSMALAGILADAGFSPQRIRTAARVLIEKDGAGFTIKRIDLSTEAEVPGIDEATFQEKAKEARNGCPVSRALAAVPEITLEARLLPVTGEQAA